MIGDMQDILEQFKRAQVTLNIARTHKMKFQNFIPVSLTQGVETKLICNFSSIHCIWQILFVCKHKEDSISQLILNTPKRI